MASKGAPQGRIVKPNPLISKDLSDRGQGSALSVIQSASNSDRPLKVVRVRRPLSSLVLSRSIFAWVGFLSIAAWSSQELKPLQQDNWSWIRPIHEKADEITKAFESRVVDLPELEPEPEEILIESPNGRVGGHSSNRAVGKFLESVIKRAAPKRRDIEALSDKILSESQEQGYDALFVAAVIRSESAFNALARSHVGAQGLMQIMPQTGRWLRNLPELDGVQPGLLTDPDYNVKLGITYLKHLETLYGGNRLLVLIAYNWGPGRVEGAFKGTRKVPGEVMRYAVKILNDYRRWRDEYHRA